MAELQVSTRVSGRGVDLDFTVAAGGVLAVLGANGAGKSTVAAVIAGLLRADSAVVTVGPRTLTDTAAGVAVPVHQRRVGLLQQDPLLFPHLDVTGNVMFGLRFGARRGSGRRGRAAAAHWLREVGVDHLADRRPATLSGGEAQRVALARALAADPEVLILDEPLAGLDVSAAQSTRAALRGVLADGDRATVLITHDLPDVVELADRVLVMDGGTVAELGPVTEVLAAPRSRFGASFAGFNLVRGSLQGTGLLVDPLGRRWHGAVTDTLDPGQQAVAVFRPAAVAVHREAPHGSPRNVVRGHIAAVESAAGGMRVRLRPEPGEAGPGLSADVTAAAVAELRLAPGEQVWFAVKSQAVALYPAAGATVRSARNGPDTAGPTLASRG